MQYLENEHLRITINEFGAELTSIIRKADAFECVWTADPTYWNRHAPLLFTIVGRLKDQQYTLDGRLYSISKHGFARDLTFSVASASATRLDLTLRATAETRKMYPYDFELTIRYTLDGDTLKKEHIVRNTTDIPLYYEIGGHDAYLLNFDQAGLSDYYLEFEDCDALSIIECDETVTLSQEHRRVPLDHGRLFLTQETFIHDALMMDQLPVHRCTLGCTKHSHKIMMDFSDFAYFAVWSPYKKGMDVPFVCLEPWSTLPDGNYLGKELEQKVGIRVLQPGQEENLSFSVTIS